MYAKNDLVELFTAKRCTRLSLDNSDDYIIVIFGDAYGDFSPRTVKSLKKENVKNALNWLKTRFYDYFHEKTRNKEEFESWHKTTCEEFVLLFNAESGAAPIKYGKAQKIVNMTFKYLYCFKDSDKYIDKFEFCHMPIDSIIIDWFIKNIYPCAKGISMTKTKLRGTSWSNLECGSDTAEGTYLWYQKLIADHLTGSANTEYLNSNGKPLSPFEAEFVIWDKIIN